MPCPPELERRLPSRLERGPHIPYRCCRTCSGRNGGFFFQEFLVIRWPIHMIDDDVFDWHLG
jgi:hypothetical protein